MEIRVIRVLEESLKDQKDFENFVTTLRDFVSEDVLPVLVVSAVANYDPSLYGFSGGSVDSPEAMAMDLSIREDRFCNLLAALLSGYFLKSHPFAVRDGIIRAKDRPGHISIPFCCDDSWIQKMEEERSLPIIPGSCALLENGNPGYIGDRGADLSSVIISEVLGQDSCYLLSDRGALFSSNSSSARAIRLPRIAYGECLEMASAGMDVPCARAIEKAENCHIKVCICRPGFHEEGTWIMSLPDKHSLRIRSVSVDKDTAKVAVLGVPDRPGIAATLFTGLAREGICVEMILQSVMRGQINDIAFLVDKKDIDKAITACRELARQLGAQGVTFDTEIARVSVVGAGISSHAEIPSVVFTVLAEKGVNIEMISASSIAITCVVSSPDAEAAVNALHEEFIEKAF